MTRTLLRYAIAVVIIAAIVGYLVFFWWKVVDVVMDVATLEEINPNPHAITYEEAA